MRIFLDTNVLVASLIAHGTCHELYEYCLAEHRICISQDVLNELETAFTQKIRCPQNILEQAISFIQRNAEIVEYIPLPTPICRDPKDDRILSAAICGKVDCLISGDEDLLVLKEIKGIPIIRPAEFWKFEKSKLS